MVGSGEVDARGRSQRSRVIGLLVDFRLLVTLSTIPPLSIELNGLFLPNGESSRDGVHQVDALFDPFDESLFEHLAKGNIVMATKPLVLLEVLNVLFSGVGDHGNILEFGSSCGGGV